MVSFIFVFLHMRAVALNKQFSERKIKNLEIRVRLKDAMMQGGMGNSSAFAKEKSDTYKHYANRKIRRYLYESQKENQTINNDFVACIYGWDID